LRKEPVSIDFKIIMLIIAKIIININYNLFLNEFRPFETMCSLFLNNNNNYNNLKDSGLEYI